MRKKLNISVIAIMLLLVSQFTFAQKKGQNELPRPKLVVGIVVDQMRWDYLYRYYDRYQNDGFKRMLNEGFTCENTFIDYVPTVTGIGHSSVYTGTVPAVHGIAGNDFIIRATGETMYCAGDDKVETVGSSSKAGKMSPRNLLSTTIGDELKLATNFRSKVIGIALKDRGAILPVGHAADAAYWFDSSTGGWITSTYYMNQLPEWVKKFNSQKLPEKYLKQDWNTLYDIKTYVQSTADNTPYEGLFDGQEAPVFPIKTSHMFKKDLGILRTTPFGNTFTLDMAKTTIENEKLGQGSVTDMLAVSLSSTDYIGHKFGVNAIEIEDTYLRLDKDLADFFKFLDQKIGKGEYTVFLTADHGAAHNIKFSVDNKLLSSNWSASKVQREMNKRLEETFKVKDLVLSIKNSQVHFNYTILNGNKLDEDEVRKVCTNYLKTQPEIAFVIDLNKIGDAAVPEEIKKRVVNGYNQHRSGGIQIVLNPAVFSSGSSGTSHSAWNPYDSHIPLVWMGWGIEKGRTNKQTHMTDIAPTVSALLRIQMPNGSIGHPIEEVMKK
ncbi:type I phosphodiesterase/nucleotide pyrophosphatase [Pseudopedobacter saltans DSM 12145]|uniref:Type I phosphodiesterase/nucleotide pyrophosphatase n=1 Tax=Pseudopedobacter saltans (strain ATCC 51119 / DSM 12145 / JCM 21818 / CCUG 39354 / LMG 10337 / NBRC 100064 / NCIMB 13643) TaxID=762903 RepID=F0SF16_PSESL|nr:alkaline phosphatase PafA [Pseudopedobacter saltans]ADY54084.1 type I phosphodiesterase/nucleotide pyrophosphatase [Pseudopedobacter saltans DSM 12145]